MSDGRASVVNKRTHNPGPDDVYIGRPSEWGNPFAMRQESDRANVLLRYRVYLTEAVRSGDIAYADLAALHGKTLVCWCAPKACHGHVLAMAARWAWHGCDPRLGGWMLEG